MTLNRCIPLTLALAAAFSISSAYGATASFSTPGATTWTVPAGVTSVTVVATGGGGAGSSFDGFAAGGAGAVVTKVLTTTGGETLTLFVGGGGGAGATAVRAAVLPTSRARRVVVRS